MMNYTLNVGGKLMSLSRPLVMGILNYTPDSFHAASRSQTPDEAARRAEAIIAEGGDIIDVGACSTRPGGTDVTEDEEMARLREALCAVRRVSTDVVVSVDTFRPDVARMCVEEFGAAIINDVGAGQPRTLSGTTEQMGLDHDSQEPTEAAVPEMFRMVARLGVPYILMSVQPTLREMLLTFARQTQQLRSLGQKDILLDPGFGFGKTLQQNYDIMDGMEQLHALELPLLVGVSRKSMIWKHLGTTPAQALNGTTALHAIALLKGAAVLRVHDVSACVETVNIVQALHSSAAPAPSTI